MDILTQNSKIKSIPYTSKNSLREIRETTLFIVAYKTGKYLGINLVKEVKDCNSVNHSTVKQKIEKHIGKWKQVPCSWIGKANIMKMTILPKMLCRYSAILIIIPIACLTELDKTNLDLIWN